MPNKECRQWLVSRADATHRAVRVSSTGSNCTGVNRSSAPPGPVVRSRPTGDCTAEKETEAQHAVALWTTIHDFLLHLSDDFFPDEPAIRAASSLLETDETLAMRALCHGRFLSLSIRRQQFPSDTSTGLLLYFGVQFVTALLDQWRGAQHPLPLDVLLHVFVSRKSLMRPGLRRTHAWPPPGGSRSTTH